MIRLDPVDVQAARSGDRAALDQVIQSASGPIFNLAIRMLADRSDAEDATQEILIKIITQLGSLREIEAAGAWAYQIACRHLLSRSRAGRIERLRFSFETFSADLEQGVDIPPPADLTSAETDIALKEVKVGCTLAMLTCLTRSLRLAYILGEILDMTDKEAAAVLGVKPGTFRQQLRRARNAIETFMQVSCGLHSGNASCRCENRLGPALASGRATVDGHLYDLTIENTPTPQELRKHVHKLEKVQRAVSVFRSTPQLTYDTEHIVKRLVPLL